MNEAFLQKMLKTRSGQVLKKNSIEHVLSFLYKGFFQFDK